MGSLINLHLLLWACYRAHSLFMQGSRAGVGKALISRLVKSMEFRKAFGRKKYEHPVVKVKINTLGWVFSQQKKKQLKMHDGLVVSTFALHLRG